MHSLITLGFIGYLVYRAITYISYKDARFLILGCLFVDDVTKKEGLTAKHLRRRLFSHLKSRSVIRDLYCMQAEGLVEPERPFSDSENLVDGRRFHITERGIALRIRD